MSKRRNKIAQGAVWVLMAMVLVGIIGFGRFNFGGSVQAIGTVGDTEISTNRYFREVNAQLNALRQQTNQAISFAQAQMFGIDQQALQSVIKQVALENETARLGVSVGDEALARRIREIDAFQGATGSFNRDTYEFVLEQSGLTAPEFEQSLRSEVARTILQSAVANGVALPEVYTDTLYGWARETRDFTWAKLDATTLDAPVGTPDDAALQAYYEAHPADFTLPETKNISYVWLRPEDVTDQVEITDDTLRALYDARIDEFQTPERRLVERLVFGTEAEADVAAKRLSDGSTSFEQLVEERGITLSDIDLGDVTEADLGAAGTTVFGLAEPGIAGPVESDLGPALFRVNAILTAQKTSFEEARAALLEDSSLDAARRLLGDMMTDLDDALAGGATLEELASERGMTLSTLGWTGSETDGIAAYDAFRAAAASASEDDYPAIEILSDGGLFALRLDALDAPRLQSLDAVRDAAVAGWQAEETLRQLMAKAEEMIGSFANGESPASLGLIEVAEAGQERSAYIDGTPPALVSRAFELAPGDWAVVEDSDGAILIRLDAITAAVQDSDEAKAAKAAFGQTTSQTLALDLEAAFAAAIEAEAGIALNQAMINSVNTSFQ